MPARFLFTTGEFPLVATALHAGHRIRHGLKQLLRLSEAERLREEDPFTDRWTRIAPIRVVGLRSRFEVDLNRPREGAFYLQPEDAWGLGLWKAPPNPEVVEQSLRLHDRFYAAMRALLDHLVRLHGRFLVLDLHSYNHRREGANAAVADPLENPEINVGTGTMERGRWQGVVERFLEDLRAVDYLGGRLDVRENVRFRGGYFPRWVHENYPHSGCVLAVEVKKFFMDEWTGGANEEHLHAVHKALAATIPGLLEALNRPWIAPTPLIRPSSR